LTDLPVDGFARAMIDRTCAELKDEPASVMPAR
jgi:hypothetical protein